ncbi:DUF397 domain-containing protein [Streptomyces montanisoli]|uniref:DUF397 domain-containing protein n=1 Tax=Streptomyces montanisoli TaxID=2798581 RepID=A0A940MCU5_9ACTN|nr:DUF397 domain-containing protein [Streptomyces montanisoli]MBP0456348.1 DUF397 domain-containing protein [Streptomyces montanisoli]
MKDAAELAWFKSTYSSGEGGQCVEVADAVHSVHVRDSKDTSRPGLTTRADAWRAFVGFAAAHAG